MKLKLLPLKSSASPERNLAPFDLFMELRMCIITGLLNDKHIYGKFSSHRKSQYGNTELIQDDSLRPDQPLNLKRLLGSETALVTDGQNMHLTFTLSLI